LQELLLGIDFQCGQDSVGLNEITQIHYSLPSNYRPHLVECADGSSTRHELVLCYRDAT
jgi:hypothetical protein